jgi:membrane protein YdbS with pleckstrin-like domain
MKKKYNEQSKCPSAASSGGCGTLCRDGRENSLAASCPSHQRLTVAGPATIAGSISGAVPAHLISEDEHIILAIKPSLWFIVFHSAPLIIILGVFLLGLRTFFLTEIFDSWSRTIHQVAALTILVQLVVSTLQWVSRLYVLTDRRILRMRGIINIEVFECPLIKIQNTYLTLAWYERLLALGSIYFTTAGTAGIEASWQNINQPLEVHELIRSAIRDAHSRWPNGQP